MAGRNPPSESQVKENGYPSYLWSESLQRLSPCSRGRCFSEEIARPAGFGLPASQCAKRAANAPRPVAVDMDVVYVHPYSCCRPCDSQLSDGSPELPLK